MYKLVSVSLDTKRKMYNYFIAKSKEIYSNCSWKWSQK